MKTFVKVAAKAAKWYTIMNTAFLAFAYWGYLIRRICSMSAEECHETYWWTFVTDRFNEDIRAGWDGLVKIIKTIIGQ